MASSPTSANHRGYWRLLDHEGQPLPAPSEWEPALIEVLVEPAAWERVGLWLQDRPLPLSLRRLAGATRILADWPRAGPGHYRLRLALDTGAGPGMTAEHVLTVQPRKISPTAFGQMLEALATGLPSDVALSLQRAGGLSGVALLPPGQTSLAQELARLRRAVLGTTGRPGLAAVLEEVARDPHRVLRTEEIWVRAERARRPPLARLARTLADRRNTDAAGQPERVIDARVDLSVDVFENRLIRVFVYQTETGLRRLVRLLSASPSEPLAEARGLLDRLTAARRQAVFLDRVALPPFLPARATMVLLKRPAYRAALTGYLEFHRSVVVRVENTALDAPLENLPRLYELWGTLHVILAVLDVAADLGYRVVAQRLAERDAAGLYLRVLPNGRPAVVLMQPDLGSEVQVVPQPRYGPAGEIRSVSFVQQPDIAIEVQRPNLPPEVLLFDPKYKLDGTEGGTGDDDRPQKGDIDKMHAYRDAIRDAESRRVVRYAAILYPGIPARFGDGLEALAADPADAERLGARLREVLRAALAPNR